MPYDSLAGKPAHVPVPLLQHSYRRICHPYARYQTLPFLGYAQPINNPFLPGYPYDRMLTMSYRQTPFMRLGKPDLMLNSTIKSEQHLPDNIAEIILELDTVHDSKTQEPNLPADGSIPPESELHKLCKFELYTISLVKPCYTHFSSINNVEIIALRKKSIGTFFLTKG